MERPYTTEGRNEKWGCEKCSSWLACLASEDTPDPAPIGAPSFLLDPTSLVYPNSTERPRRSVNVRIPASSVFLCLQNIKDDTRNIAEIR